MIKQAPLLFLASLAIIAVAITLAEYLIFKGVIELKNDLIKTTQDQLALMHGQIKTMQDQIALTALPLWSGTTAVQISRVPSSGALIGLDKRVLRACVGDEVARKPSLCV